MNGFGEQNKSKRKKVSYLRSKKYHHQILLKALKFHSEGNTLEAAKYYEYLIENRSQNESVFNNYGMILINLGKLKEAELYIRKAIELNPNDPISYLNLGGIFKDLGKLKEAELYIHKAIELNPSDPISYSNLGGILKDLGKLKEAELYINKAIKLNPDFGQAYYNMGCVLEDLGKLYDAINFFKKSIKLNPQDSDAKWHLITCKGKICDWSDQKTQNLWLEKIGIEGSHTQPLGLFYYEDDPLKDLLRAKNLYKKKYYRQSKSIHPLNNKKICIGYFSADFRAHPVMYLLTSILKLHDKSKFKIYLYSFVPKEDEYTEIAKKSGCTFKDIKRLNDDEVVDLVRNDKLDIAIDLMGYTENNRASIFAYRVAPIQINYLGYPGTLGAESIDYIIADEIIIPKEFEKFYTENIIRMPSCYQCNDNKKEICQESISRKQFNLPEKGFVFTSFCANKKITPNEFNIWMRLLSQIKGSVLWLDGSNKYAIDNLLMEAEKRNIDPKRLVFAKKLPLLKKHLARYSLGDLGLDTFNFNGHTTTSDALWSGLPVLTKKGDSFAARVSASIIDSLGLPELITNSEKEYEEKALYLAKNPEKLTNLKSQLVKLRKTSTLFNSQLFTKNLEKKFIELNLKHSL